MARGKVSDAGDLERLEWPHPWPPPWRIDRLLGHQAAEATLLAAHRSGRMHHAWLLGGPRGIGKASLAWRFARFLLCGSAGGGLFGDAPDSLDVAADAPARGLVDGRAHPDLFHLRRTVNDQGRVRTEIAVDDVRKLGEFLHRTPAMGGWRVAIVDSADELNRSSANALLKLLEEPPARAVLLLVAHAPGRLLPTIRSRCHKLPLDALEDQHVTELLGRLAPELAADDRPVVAALAEGSIGRALEFAASGSVTLYRDMTALLATLPAGDMPRLHAFADRFARRGEAANAEWRTFGFLIDGWLKALIREAAGASRTDAADGAIRARLAGLASLDRWVGAWEKVADLISRADAVNLDRKQTVLGAFLALQAATR
ncbi:MAG: DNA polymerase III subunit delta' [Alphaproteobacteria bacterium]|nr:DNA polymerase III subunit delta' [Alphaproteobacteria bacterium]